MSFASFGAEATTVVVKLAYRTHQTEQKLRSHLKDVGRRRFFESAESLISSSIIKIIEKGEMGES